MSTTLLLPNSDFIASALNGALAAAATTATIGTGLDIPATNGILQIDYDSTTAMGSDNGPETISYATYTIGTGALAGMVRGLNGSTDVAHANGAKVQSGLSVSQLKDFCGARAFLTATLGTTVDSTLTKVALDGETFDVGANFASNKFTAPVNGYYDIKGVINYANMVADKTSAAAIYVDGAQVSIAYSAVGTVTSSSATVHDVRYLAAGSYVELYYYHNAGATTPDVVGDASGLYTFLTVHLIKEV